MNADLSPSYPPVSYKTTTTESSGNSHNKGDETQKKAMNKGIRPGTQNGFESQDLSVKALLLILILNR